MTQPIDNSRLPIAARFQHLDMLRGLAALLVFLGHLRAFTFVNLGALLHASIGLKLFYAVTSLGHQAVIVFFALSGYLVGGKALDDMLRGRWRWDHYLLRRLTRLWIVLLPALGATLLLDQLGLSVGGVGYSGEFYTTYVSGPQSGSHSFMTLIGNVFFLQTICVPTFGTNGPLWSLANEFWYYMVFPLAAFIVFLRGRFYVSCCAIILLVILAFLLPFWLLAAGLIWVAGAAAAWASRRVPLIRYFRHPIYVIVTGVLAVGGLLYGRIPSNPDPDLIFGLAVALCLPALTHLASPARFYDRVARGLAEMSYTLYLTHFPFLSFLFFTWAAPHRWDPSVGGALIYIGAAAVTFLWAIVFWWCFERNTDRVFHILQARLPKAYAKLRPNAALP